MKNPYMTNYSEMVGKNKPIGEQVYNKKVSLISDCAENSYTKINNEEVTILKEVVKNTKIDNALSEIEKWLNKNVFKDGVYNKIDRKTSISLAKYMFKKGIYFSENYGAIKLEDVK